MTSSSNILWEEELKDMESGSLALPLQCHPSVEAHYNVSVFITVSIYVKSQFQFLLRHFCFLSMTEPRVTHSRPVTEFGPPTGWEKERAQPTVVGNCVFVTTLVSSSSQTVSSLPRTFRLYSSVKLAPAARQGAARYFTKPNISYTDSSSADENHPTE